MFKHVFAHDSAVCLVIIPRAMFEKNPNTGYTCKHLRPTVKHRDILGLLGSQTTWETYINLDIHFEFLPNLHTEGLMNVYGKTLNQVIL